ARCAPPSEMRHPSSSPHVVEEEDVTRGRRRRAMRLDDAIPSQASEQREEPHPGAYGRLREVTIVYDYRSIVASLFDLICFLQMNLMFLSDSILLVRVF
ncbi:hypothetical protein PENTCL1PPCAC_23648, partial [Pristionchus entomophagus]